MNGNTVTIVKIGTGFINMAIIGIAGVVDVYSSYRYEIMVIL